MRYFKLVVFGITLPVVSFCQAFLSPQGEGSVSVLYQYSIDRLHAFSDGRTKDVGHMYWNSVALDVDYSLTDRLAVRASVPFLDGKYTGSSPHTRIRGDSSTLVMLDDGAWHGTVTDFRLDVRYSLTRGKLKIVPDFQATLPAHPYPTFLHAVYGADNREYRAGVSVGRSLDPISRKAFFQGRYGFGVSEKIANVAPHVSYGEFQLGYFLNRRIMLQGAVSGMYTHNGIRWDYDAWPGNLTQEQWVNHLRISQNKLLDAAGTIGYSFNGSTSVVLSVGHSFWGENTHLRYVVTTVGFVKAFSAPWSKERATAAMLPDGTKATTCTCAKTK
ncbi:MAG TPA: hypothetical protein VKE70_16610 [Candidatus Solibacter sp.]|nr:hypothetical protein [Candidatus Solibacter sp.]